MVASAQRLSNHGIGASEIAAICGLNPFASPWDIWLRKTGQAPDVEPNDPIEWGHRLESAILAKYADETGLHILVPSHSVFHQEQRYARATPDGVAFVSAPEPAIAASIIDPAHGGVIAASGADRAVQVKNVGYWMEKEWSKAPPTYVQLQEQWEMFVCGLGRADISVLIGGNDWRPYTIWRDDKLIADLQTIAEDFWRLVETRTEPKVDDSDACAAHFTKKLKREAIEINADAELDALAGEWRELHIRQKADEKRLKTVKNAIRKALAEAGADRLKTSHDIIRLQATGGRSGTTETNWRMVAELIASTRGVSNDELQALVAENTTTTPGSEGFQTPYPPRSWAKEAI